MNPDAFLPFIADDRPLHEHAGFAVGAHMHLHSHRIGRILQIKDGFLPVLVQPYNLLPLAFQAQGEGTVRLGNAEIVLPDAFGRPSRESASVVHRRGAEAESEKASSGSCRRAP